VLVVFALVRYTDLTPESVPGGGDVDGSRLAAWFDRWGLSALALSNALPVARGPPTVPAAMAEETPVRLSASSLAGTSVCTCSLSAVAAGVETLVALV